MYRESIPDSRLVLRPGHVWFVAGGYLPSESPSQEEWNRWVARQVEMVPLDSATEAEYDIVLARPLHEDGTTFAVLLPEVPPFAVPDTTTPPPVTSQCSTCNQDRVLVVWLMMLQARLDNLTAELGACRPSPRNLGPRDPPPPAAPAVSLPSPPKEDEDEPLRRRVAALSLVDAQEDQMALPAPQPTTTRLGRGRGARRVMLGRGRGLLAVQEFYRQLEQSKH